MEPNSGEVIRYDEYGMRLRMGRDPGLRMEDTGGEPTISDIGDSTPVASISPTTGETLSTDAPSDAVETALDDVNIDDLDTSDLDTDTAEVEEDDDADADQVSSFDNLEAANKHIAKVNRQDAAKRVELKPFREAFENFNDEEKGQLLGLMSELGTSPQTAAEKLIAVGNIILGNDPSTTTNTPQADAEVDLDKPLTMRELQAQREKEDTDREFKKSVDQVFSDARDLGYADGTVEQRVYLSVLAGEADGDSAKAHSEVQALFQRKIKEYIDGKRGQRDKATASSSTSLSTETESHNPKSWAEATAAAVARNGSKVGQ